MMDKKTTDIVAYITLIGLILAFCAGDREASKFHLNQALVLCLFSLLCAIPFVGWLWGIFILVCWVIGLIGAIWGEDSVIPLLGSIHLLK